MLTMMTMMTGEKDDYIEDDYDITRNDIEEDDVVDVNDDDDDT